MKESTFGNNDPTPNNKVEQGQDHHHRIVDQENNVYLNIEKLLEAADVIERAPFNSN